MSRIDAGRYDQTLNCSGVAYFGAASLTMSPPRAIYVHVPFCQTICGYCDFYSQVLDRPAVDGLVNALIAELDAAERVERLAAETIFVGGGTPTTLPPAALGRLLGRLRASAAAGVEFSVEANPATVTPEIAAVLVESGVTRVSIGAQSFDPSELRVLDRIHRPEQVEQTVGAVRAAGIDNVNLDLIFAVPGQSLVSWLANLRAALALRPDHLSCYGLTYERGTPLYEWLAAGAVQRADSELEAAMFEATIDALAAAGLRHYEISNFARPGRECRHNLVYWHNQPHVGLGPSAAGLVGGVRYKNIPDTAEYVRAIRGGRSPRVQSERLTPDARARETAILELRLIEGIGRGAFLERFGRDPVELFGDAVRKHVGLGLLEVDAVGIRLTRRGLLLADSVMADFA